MCGIAGVVGRAEQNALERMAAALRHRGPDDRGTWTNPDASVGLVHTRLSILDLSAAGHQPMISDDREHVLVFNGEIYNHLDLRSELERQSREPWRGHSDTETLLRAFLCWGVLETVKKCRGMFAFAFWDERKRTLTLGRDRFGEKPLYYGRQGNRFFFASDLAALRAHPEFRREIDREALGAYLFAGYIPSPLSVYTGIQKLPPGTLLTVPGTGSGPAEPEPYWSLVETAIQGRANPFRGSEEEAVARLDELISASMRGQKLSDVPLGAFLSGGIDSSLITAHLQRQSSQPVLTFTIGFQEESHDEASQARAVAKILGTAHHELYLTPDQAQAMIPELPGIYGEPFADPSQLPTLLLSQFARKSVTVSLSGDGGDELFCGYTRYRHMAKLVGLPPGLRSGLASLLTVLSPEGWDTVLAATGRKFLGDKIHKAAQILRAPDRDAMYVEFLSRSTFGLPPAARQFLDPLHDIGTRLPDPHSRLMAFDAVTYLPDDVLCKVDRAAMAVSLETRIPLLDHEVAAFAWTLPVSMNLKNGAGKWLLRKSLMKFLPEALVERPKRGFAVPIGEWLRGPLRPWAEDLLDERTLGAVGLFDLASIQAKWREHVAGTRNWHYQLWTILMLQGWLRSAKIA